MNEPIFLAVFIGVHICKTPRIFNSISPSFQEISAKIEDNSSLFKSIFRNIGTSKSNFVCFCQTCLSKQVEFDTLATACGLKPFIDKTTLTSHCGFAEISDCAGCCLYYSGKLLHSFFPWDLFPIRKWIGVSIGIVKRLH